MKIIRTACLMCGIFAIILRILFIITANNDYKLYADLLFWFPFFWYFTITAKVNALIRKEIEEQKNNKN